jgi:hypothetical protein
MTHTDRATSYALARLTLQQHVEAISGPPADDPELCRLAMLRRASIAAYARWLARYAEPGEIRERWESKGAWN